jgi:O-antigen/teichoic acid export membrane protein
MFQRIKNFLFENQSLKQSIAKNTFWLFSGQLLGRITRIAIVVYAARILGPASWGAFSYAMGLVAFLTIFTDIGVSAIVTRESAKNPAIGDRYFSTAFFLKLVFLILGAALLIFGAPYITNLEEAKMLLPIISLVLIFDSLRNFGFAISRANEKMQWEGINEVLTNIAITGLGFWALNNSATSQSLTASYALAVGIGFLLIAWQLRHYFKNLLTNLDYSLIKPILSMAWPFALASSLGAVMINTDLIMLGWLTSAEEVGFYSVAQRPIQLLYVLPTIFAVSLFPTFSRLANQDNAKFKEILETALKIALLAALPIAAGGMILGDQIINLLFGAAYQSAIPAFQILLLTVLIVFPSAIISNAIFSYNQQNKFVAFSALGATGNIFFNFLLIPLYGIAGCAAATIFTQLIANGFIWKKMKEVNSFQVIGQSKKIIVATTIIAGALLVLKDLGMGPILNLILAFPIYFGTLKILKEELLDKATDF